MSNKHVLVDTSVALALLVDGHEAHKLAIDRLGGLTLGLAGHAAFETYSVLTRLPPPARQSPMAVHRLLNFNFPESRFLSQPAADQLPGQLAELGIAGGSVYDALVAAAAAEHGLVLFSRDRRAAETYRALDVDLQLLV